MFIQQMQYIVDHSIANGRDIAFVVSVGDVWQHQTETIDQDHLQVGIDIESDPILARNAKFCICIRGSFLWGEYREAGLVCQDKMHRNL